MKCSICGKAMSEDQQCHNAEPINAGVCCTACNATVVLNARMNKVRSMLSVPEPSNVFTKKGEMN